jgi:hypothetical protein
MGPHEQAIKGQEYAWGQRPYKEKIGMGLKEVFERKKEAKRLSESEWAYKQRAEKLREDRRQLENRLEYYREKEQVDKLRREYAAKHGMAGRVIRGIQKGQGILSKIPASNYDPYAGMRQTIPTKTRVRKRSRKTRTIRKQAKPIRKKSIWDF